MLDLNVHGQMKDEVFLYVSGKLLDHRMSCFSELLNVEICGSHRTDTLHIYDDLIDYDVMWPFKAITVWMNVYSHVSTFDALSYIL